jgi:hypothetical protein
MTNKQTLGLESKRKVLMTFASVQFAIYFMAAPIL